MLAIMVTAALREIGCGVGAALLGDGFVVSKGHHFHAAMHVRAFSMRIEKVRRSFINTGRRDSCFSGFDAGEKAYVLRFQRRKTFALHNISCWLWGFRPETRLHVCWFEWDFAAISNCKSVLEKI